MFLRSLQIRGFKSFADRTVLEFAPGISVVVGPNGSGKSNLVDAIAWVLGEQGPRALRGGHMADVIFAGSPGRQALGMAEVTLVIDNEQGLIPVPDAEIEVGRVVYRSGESQYLLGGKPVRLLDILELLSDTGIGRALHTVVGQGQLEDVLVARPEERRQFIEEAAGIAKHRRRKERAQRKLTALDADLLRLQDVIKEVNRRLRPLKQQAEAAGKHERLTAEAQEAAWRLAAGRLRDLYAERDRRRAGWEEGRTRRAESEGRLKVLDEEIAGLAERLAEAEAALARAETEEGEAVQARTDAEEALRHAVHTEGEARARLAASGGLDVERLRAELADTTRALEEREARLEQEERAFEDAKAVRERAAEVHREARERSLGRQAELATLRRSLDAARSDRDRQTSALDEVRRRESQTAAARDEVEAEIERLDGETGPATDNVNMLRTEAERLEGQLAGLEERARELEVRRGILEVRRSMLSETPGRRLLGRGGRNAIGLLAELIDVDKGMERAVAAALGALADAVVYPGHAEAVADAGRAAGATLAVPYRAPGFVIAGERPILDVVRPDPRAAEVLAAALRHVYLARNADDAVAKHRRHPGASFVSPDGVLVGPGVVRSAPGTAQDELALRREAALVDRELADIRREVAVVREQAAQAEAQRTRAEEALRRADAAITAAADRMGRLDVELAALRREREVLEEGVAGIEVQLASVMARVEAHEQPDEGAPDIPPAPEPPMQLRVEVESLRRERDRLQEALGEQPSMEREGEGAAMPDASTATAARERAETALGQAAERATAASTARQQAAHLVGDLRGKESEANRAWREAAAALQRLRDEYEEEDTARRDLERRIGDAERVLRTGHGKEPQDAVATLGPDEDVASLQKRSDLVARRLALLGRVNLVAQDEYRELQDRHDFLQREADDVRRARRDLQQLIREVDRKVSEIAGSAFEDVAREFSALFARLFPGGEGKMTLTDPENLLETGVELEARPGRKRVKRLSLLSGGERALTAIAFLFAIFRARPSPFYLLDEVEAALDDVNLCRFVDLIQEFRDEAQLLVVSH
ncbi:MAG TPA: AAA family ATPase, partial [Actinomycetota bacterium]|nr:AAA family ATPase [Actinomycetota bacterium]